MVPASLAAAVFRVSLSPCLEPRHGFRSAVIIGVLGESFGLAAPLTHRLERKQTTNQTVQNSQIYIMRLRNVQPKKIQFHAG